MTTEERVARADVRDRAMGTVQLWAEWMKQRGTSVETKRLLWLLSTMPLQVKT